MKGVDLMDCAFKVIGEYRCSPATLRDNTESGDLAALQGLYIENAELAEPVDEKLLCQILDHFPSEDAPEDALCFRQTSERLPNGIEYIEHY